MRLPRTCMSRNSIRYSFADRAFSKTCSSSFFTNNLNTTQLSPVRAGGTPMSPGMGQEMSSDPRPYSRTRARSPEAFTRTVRPKRDPASLDEKNETSTTREGIPHRQAEGRAAVSTAPTPHSNSIQPKPNPHTTSSQVNDDTELALEHLLHDAPDHA